MSGIFEHDICSVVCSLDLFLGVESTGYSGSLGKSAHVPVNRRCKYFRLEAGSTRSSCSSLCIDAIEAPSSTGAVAKPVSSRRHRICKYETLSQASLPYSTVGRMQRLVHVWILKYILDLRPLNAGCRISVISRDILPTTTLLKPIPHPLPRPR